MSYLAPAPLLPSRARIHTFLSSLLLFLLPVYQVESWPMPILDNRKRPGGCITVDFATAASQNGFCIYQLSLHRKSNVITKMTKNIIFFYYFLRKRDITCHILSYKNNVLWCRCRGIRRDVVYLCWPIPPHIYESKRGGVAGSQPMSTAVHITWPGAQINFGDLPPYLS
jgi:hypothetical protein